MNSSAGSALQRAESANTQRWGGPSVVARAPGRVNLIGEHTDYNEGFAMPMALPFDTVVALTDSGDDTVTVDAADFGEVSFDLDTDLDSVPTWAHHLVGCVRLLHERHIRADGWNAAIATDIPTGASLSSSAALEVAVITALLGRAGASWSSIEIAELGQRVENEVVGLQSGIMDQFISAGATAGHASIMDCRSSTLRPVPIPASATVVVMDTGTRRVLAEAAYGDRRRDCEAAAAELGVMALRDATAQQVATLTDPIVRMRARHIVTENLRVLSGAEALADDDPVTFGELMYASHVSLRDDFEVSGPGLNAIVDAAMKSPGCLGARMTGGGFAGCAVALVDSAHVAEFIESVTRNYAYDDHRATLWTCSPGPGASLVAV